VKILKQGATEIYNYTCEEIIEETCPVCKAVFEYTGNDIKKEVIENRFYEQQLLAYNSSFCNPYCSRGDLLRFPPPLPVQSYLHTYIVCPCCKHKITIL
jgi:hypothetical protein